LSTPIKVVCGHCGALIVKATNFGDRRFLVVDAWRGDTSNVVDLLLQKGCPKCGKKFRKAELLVKGMNESRV